MILLVKKKLKLITVAMLFCLSAIPSFAYPVFMIPSRSTHQTRAPHECPTINIENNEMILYMDYKSYVNAKVIIKDNKSNVIITCDIPYLTESDKYNIDISSLKHGVTYEIDFVDMNTTFQGYFDIE